MAKRGKTIQVFLMDGEANGRIKATISNWNGLAYKIPREKLFACKERDDLSQSSVYFLFGSTSEGKRDVVYIGQAGIRKNGGGILTRLMEHDKNPDKDYWTEAVVFTTSNNSFGQTELSFLENRFCNMALEAKRFEVKNAVEPTPGNITEEKESELEEYADYAELILGVLGYKVFDPVKGVLVDGASTNSAITSTTNTAVVVPINRPATKSVPPLPDTNQPIGRFVQAAMKQLSESGYVFDQAIIDEMCTPDWSMSTFHTRKPFLRRYVHGETTTRDASNYVRFYATPYTFGDTKVLLSKEWYANQFDYFISWYNSLR